MRPLISLIAFITLTGAADATDTVTFYEEAYVSGPDVTLGDVANVDGEHADFLATLPVAEAASPGNITNISAQSVMARLRSSGVDTETIKLGGAARVEATTLHEKLTQERITEELRNFIEVEMPWDSGDTTIEIVAPSTDIVLPAGDLTLEWTPNPQYRYLGNGTFRGSVLVDGVKQRDFYARASIETYREVLVASRDIRRGSTLSASNVTLEKRALSALKGGSFESLEDLSGYVTRATFFPGQVITARKLDRKQLVRRNQMVSVEATYGNLCVRSQARAMDNGAAGDIITVCNEQSKQKFEGTIRSDGVIVVP